MLYDHSQTKTIIPISQVPWPPVRCCWPVLLTLFTPYFNRSGLSTEEEENPTDLSHIEDWDFDVVLCVIQGFLSPDSLFLICASYFRQLSAMTCIFVHHLFYLYCRSLNNETYRKTSTTIRTNTLLELTPPGALPDH